MIQVPIFRNEDNSMKREKWYISTIDENAQELAETYGLGLEIAEYCTAWNMDEHFEEVDAAVRQKLDGKGIPVLHAPFNELFPCAIDKMVREVAGMRYRQAFKVAAGYGVNKIVIHAGYNPRLYYPVWYTEQTAEFWKEFANEIPEGIEVCLENVFEEEIDMFQDILKKVDCVRLKICLDIGHVSAYSQTPVEEWIIECAPYISHFHIHNNDGETDFHYSLQEGIMDMKKLLLLAEELCPEATFTIECVNAEPSVEWLISEGLI